MRHKTARFLVASLAGMVVVAFMLPACGGPQKGAAGNGPASGHVGKVMLAKLHDAGFSARIAISGTMCVDSQTMELHGAGEVCGPDSHETVTRGSGSSARTSETYEVGGWKYKQKHGHWTKSGAAEPAMGALLARVTSLRNGGIVTHDGKTAYRFLTPTAFTLSPEDIGLPQSTQIVDGSLEFFAAEDGSPLALTMHATWTQDGHQVTTASHYDFSGVGSAIEVSEPQDVWATYSSRKLGVSLMYPDTGSSPEASHSDVFIDVPGGYVDVYRIPFGVFQPAGQAWTGDVLLALHIKGWTKVGPAHSRFIRFAGRHTELVTQDYRDSSGIRQQRLFVLGLKGHVGYLIAFDASPRASRDGVATFMDMLKTVRFT